MTVDAVVLAGGKNGPEMREATGVENRALTTLGAKTMLGHVTDALAGAPSVGRVFVVGDVPASESYRTVTYQSEKKGGTLLESLMAGLAAAREAEESGKESGKESGNGGGAARVLLSASDIPFLTPEAVEDFVGSALGTGADLCFSYVPVGLCYARFPEMKRTAIKLREGRLTLGNLFLVDPKFLMAHRDTIARAYAARKSPFKVGRLLGAGLLLRFLLAQALSPALLSVADLEAGVGRLIGGGCRARGVRSDFPEIGADVDKPEDVAVARRLLGGGV